MGGVSIICLVLSEADTGEFQTIIRGLFKDQNGLKIYLIDHTNSHNSMTCFVISAKVYKNMCGHRK